MDNPRRTARGHEAKATTPNIARFKLGVGASGCPPFAHRARLLEDRPRGQSVDNPAVVKRTPTEVRRALAYVLLKGWRRIGLIGKLALVRVAPYAVSVSSFRTTASTIAPPSTSVVAVPPKSGVSTEASTNAFSIAASTALAASG